MAQVVIRGLNKMYDDVHAVKDVNLEIRDKEFMVFVGPSGCGKTTTLRMIAGLETITSGQIMIGDTVVNDLPPMDRDIAMVFQNYALYPHMSVFDNMAFGLKMRKFPRAEIIVRVREAARTILASLTMQHIYDNPLLSDDGRVDSVMRINYDIERAAFESIAALTLGRFKDLLLETSGEEAGRLGRGLTGVMAAAVAKLCDTHELIYIARKIRRPTQARTRLGLPGRLSSRLQPNHPVDDPRGVAMLVYQKTSNGSPVRSIRRPQKFEARKQPRLAMPLQIAK